MAETTGAQAPAALAAPRPYDGLRLISASQISKYRECARKWAWQYLARIPQPMSKAAALGDAIDGGQLQPYLRDGRPLDFTAPDGSADIAVTALPYLPPVEPGVGAKGIEVQKHFVIPSPRAAQPGGKQYGFQGYLDLWAPDGGVMPASAFDTEPHRGPVVVDFKSKGDLRYALTKEQLATDVQAQLYALWALYATRTTAVDLVWINMQTRGARKVKRVHLRVHAEHVAEQFTAIDATAADMFDVRAGAPAAVTDPTTDRGISDYVLSLNANWDMCDKYGGCPYFHRCNPSPADLFSIPEVSDMTQQISTAQLLANLKAGSPAPAAQPAPLNPPSDPMFAAIASEQKAKEAARAAQAAPALPAWATAPTDPLTGRTAPGAGQSAAVVNPGAVLGINPPEAALPPAPTNVLPEPPPVAAAEAPKKRGRPKRAVEGAAIVGETTATEPLPNPVDVVIDYKALADAIIDGLVARLGGGQ